MEKENHRCEYCGEEAQDFDRLPNGRKIYLCGNSRCHREYAEDLKSFDDEARQKAEEDNYDRYR